MHDQSSPPDRYWLMAGAAPSGPFTVAEIHAKVAGGEITWQTPACPVGGTSWLPLSQTAGVGPSAPPADTNVPFPAVVPPPGATPTPAATTAAAAGTGSIRSGLVAAALTLAGLAALGYGAYEWVRPLTATEVCERVFDAEKPAELKPYTTPRFQAFAEAMFADDSFVDPNDTFELTQDIPGSRADVRLVGIHGTTFVQEAGRRVRIEGHIRVVKSDAWRVDDMVMTSAEGAALDGPVSLVDLHQQEMAAKQASRAGAANRPPFGGHPDLRPWYERMDAKTKTRLIVGLVIAVVSIAGGAGAQGWGRRSATTADDKPA